jgi:hypothetical protein
MLNVKERRTCGIARLLNYRQRSPVASMVIDIGHEQPGAGGNVIAERSEVK